MLLAAAAIFCFGQLSFAQGTWTKVTLDAPHYNGGVMLLLTDGTILCKSTGGGGSGNLWDRLKPDATGSYINGTWTTVAPMIDDRLYFSSQVLPDGRVYVAGGEYGAGGDNSEVYNPATNTWTACPSIITGLPGISDANSELLANGKVLQAVVSGGTRNNYLYDPSTNTYAATGSCLRTDNEAPWLKLPDSSIVFQDGYSTTSERYIYATNTWINDGVLSGGSLYDPFGDETGSGHLLPNGKGFFIGSTPKTAFYTPSGSVAPGVWAAGPALPNGWGATDAAAAMMPNGKILIALGPAPTSSDHFHDSTSFFEFDYTTNTFTALSAPGVTGDTLVGIPCYFSNMLVMPDGSILFANQYDNSYYEYKSVGAPIAAGKPTISNIIEKTCTDFTITGTLFNGICEGAAFGDDWQNSTNYPIVRLTNLATGNIYYATTSLWNRVGAVMTGALPDTAQFTIPGTVPNGPAMVEVVVNGNPSAKYPITIGPATLTPSVVTLCSGNTATLSTSIGGGTWSSGATTLATVDVSGVVSGVSGGVANITYGLGTCISTATVTVVSSPSAIIPAGPVNVCLGIPFALSDATLGGAWSSGNTTIATVSSGGVVLGGTLGSATVFYTSSGCSVSVPLTVNSLPGAITGTKNVCSGLTTALSDGGGGAWTSGNTTVATVNPGTGVVTGAAFGTSVITYTLASGCTATAVVTVNLTASAITGNTNICLGSSSALSNSTVGGVWSSSNTSVATVVGGTVTSASVGTATISYKLVSGCNATTIVTVNPVPAVITGTPNVCVGATTSLSDASGSGVWTSGNTTIATVNSASGLVTGVSAGTASVSYMLSGGCSVNKVITVNSVPAAITGTATVCSGQTTDLSDATSGGVWSTGNSTVATVVSGTVTGVTPGTATINYTLGSGCGSNMIVTVVASPAAITGNPLLCVGLSTTLSDATPAGAWTSSNTSVATVSGSGLVNGITPGTSTITYALGSGCAATLDVSVNTPPGIIIGTTLLCAGNATALSDVVSGGVWSSSNTAIATAGASTGIITGVAPGTATITYSLGAGCDATAPATILLSPAAITGLTSTCIGLSIALSDVTSGGVWTSSSTSVATVSGSGLVTGMSSGSSTISYALGSGCATGVVVNIGAPGAGTITGASGVCIGQATALTDATSGGVWSSSSTSKATVSSTGLVSGIAAGTATISYKVTTACGSATATQIITINSLPVVASIGGLPNVCVAGTTTLSDATPSGVWSSGNTSLATVSGAGVVSGVAMGSAPISYTVTNISGCVASAVTTIAVNAPIAAVITPASSTVFCTGGFVMLNATSGTGYTYQWQVGGIDISGATSSGYLVNYSGNFTVVINGPSICASLSPAVNVTVNPSSIVVPAVSIGTSPGTVLCMVSSPVTFTPAPTNGGLAPAYKWYVNGTLAATAGTYTYSPSNGDVVKCLMTSNATCAFPDSGVSSVTMTISPAHTPSVNIAATPGDTVCTGKVTTFTAIPAFGGLAPAYSWSKNAVTVPGAVGSSYTYIPVNGDIIRCTMVSNYTCLATTTAISSPFKIHVQAPSANSVTIKVTQAHIATGQIDTFVAIAPHGGPAPTYQWYLNGVALTGETSATYITSTLIDGDIVKCTEVTSDDCASPATATSNAIKMQVGGGVGIRNTSNGTGEFTLIPNPNDGAFNISGNLRNSTDGKVVLTITNMLGQAVYTDVFTALNGQFDQRIVLAQTLANGTYLVNVTSGDQHTVFHMVVNK